MTFLKTVQRIWRRRNQNNSCGFVVKSFSFYGKMSLMESVEMEWFVYIFANDNLLLTKLQCVSLSLKIQRTSKSDNFCI